MFEQLDIKSAVVTIDAAGCYTEIVDAVVDNGGNDLNTLMPRRLNCFPICEQSIKRGIRRPSRNSTEIEFSVFRDIPCVLR